MIKTAQIRISDELKIKLRRLADRYEVASFTEEDPSQFLKWYEPEAGRGTVADVEAAAFIAAMLAFGNRKQFIPKVREILQTSDRSLGSVSKWLKTGAFAKDFPHGAAKFYRFYSYDDMQIFFGELGSILNKAKTLGDFFELKFKEGKAFPSLQPASQSSATPSPRGTPPKTPEHLCLADYVAAAFPKSAIVPKGHSSANKRIHMFLRWMVRRDSPVDLGLWQWADPAGLLIPLDVHVMQEAGELGLIPPSAAASRKTAELLTVSLNLVFPGDPCRGDYALFGLGVDKQ